MIIYYCYYCCLFLSRFPYRSLLHYACIFCFHLWHWSVLFLFDMERMQVFFFSVLHVLEVHSSGKLFKATQELSPNLVV